MLEEVKCTRQGITSSVVGYKPISNSILAQKLTGPVQVVQTKEEELEVYEFWVDIYQYVYPAFEIPRYDPQNAQAHILFTRNAAGKMDSCIRLTADSSLGMPSEGYYPLEVAMYRELGFRLMEFGRMINNTKSLDALKAHHRLVYQIAVAEAVDVIIMTLKQKHVAFYHNLTGAYLLAEDMHIPHGGKHKVSCVAWDVKQTKQRFFKWVGLSPESKGILS